MGMRQYCRDNVTMCSCQKSVYIRCGYSILTRLKLFSIFFLSLKLYYILALSRCCREAKNCPNCPALLLPDDDHLVAELQPHQFLVLTAVAQLQGHLQQNIHFQNCCVGHFLLPMSTFCTVS